MKLCRKVMVGKDEVGFVEEYEENDLIMVRCLWYLMEE